ncbi:LysR substrate-binding domain-containing protein [Vibrio sp. MarTm2]|uniref:LysR substrate-binding domain-containing protein n=1 Tax=Vibrio sp. MarTm2 TaxID=2998831 RepID=UPI0022CD1FBF|nr:LysR substrate-binding domain-containing protein [Vibrio sp. MarTm2]MDA0128501.1 LysR substrate-binding domain-containing protein [Vibrio sp. MarTm2]
MDNRLRYLSGLRYFEAAARLSSFSKAAEELFVSQAAVSKQVRQLEEQLACKLFIRSGREMVLTQEGQSLIFYVSSAFNTILSGLNQIKSEPIEGALVVGSPPSFATRWLLPKLWKFSLSHPEIPVKVLNTYEVHALKVGEVDISIMQGEDLCLEDGLTSEILVNEPVYPYCSPLLADSIHFREPEDLLKCWLIYYGTGCYPWESWFNQANVSAEASSDQRVEVDTFDMALNTVMTGHGVCLATDSLAGDLMDRGLLVKPFDIGLRPGVQVNLCTDASSPRRDRIKLFTQWLHQEAAVKSNAE